MAFVRRVDLSKGATSGVIIYMRRILTFLPASPALSERNPWTVRSSTYSALMSDEICRISNIAPRPQYQASALYTHRQSSSQTSSLRSGITKAFDKISNATWRNWLDTARRGTTGFGPASAGSCNTQLASDDMASIDTCAPCCGSLLHSGWQTGTAGP